MNDEAVITETDRKLMSVPWRIWEICVARANNWGHAAFRKNELVRLCCGQNTPADRLTVKRGMQRLVDMNRIAPMDGEHGSTVFCVIVNQYYVWRGAGKGGRKDICFEPDHKDSCETPWTTHVLPEKKASDDPWDSSWPSGDSDDDKSDSADDTSDNDQPSAKNEPSSTKKSWRETFDDD
jgi:hypothetical protein